jgi:2-oxoisovalerate dehydrogenase E1 component
VAARAAGYGLPGLVVDGNDALAVYAAAGEAVARARRGQGPTLLECRTYRTRAHSEGMRDAGYRSTEEVAAWKQRDPIAGLRTVIVERHAADAELEAIDREVAALVADAAAFAESSPWPDVAGIAAHIYSDEPKGA